MAKVMELYDELCYPQDIFAANPDDTKLIEIFALATLPEYQGRGIGLNLVKESIEMAKKADCSSMLVFASHDFTRKICKKLDFEFVAARSWKYCRGNFKEEVKSEMASTHYLKLSKH